MIIILTISLILFNLSDNSTGIGVTTSYSSCTFYANAAFSDTFIT